MIAGLVGVFVYDVWRSGAQELSEDSWRNAGPVAVSSDYAIVLQEQPAHAFLAEYHYRLHVFRRGTGNGGRVRRVELPMNPGGLTHLDVYAYVTGGGQVNRLDLDDRHMQTTMVDLCDAGTIAECDVPTTRTFVGTFEGAEYPLQFIPAAVGVEHRSWPNVAGR
jgi:hypothetical protein